MTLDEGSIADPTWRDLVAECADSVTLDHVVGQVEEAIQARVDNPSPQLRQAVCETVANRLREWGQDW